MKDESRGEDRIDLSALRIRLCFEKRNEKTGFVLLRKSGESQAVGGSKRERERGEEEDLRRKRGERKKERRKEKREGSERKRYRYGEGEWERKTKRRERGK